VLTTRLGQKVGQCLLLAFLLRRGATAEFSPAFEGRDQPSPPNIVALATAESFTQSVADATTFVSLDPGLERPG
jgi:hypothetical protein